MPRLISERRMGLLKIGGKRDKMVFEWEEVLKMAETIPQHCRDIFSDSMLNDPALWSESMVKETCQRLGRSSCNVQEVQSVIKNYLDVLGDALRKGEQFQ